MLPSSSAAHPSIAIHTHASHLAQYLAILASVQKVANFRVKYKLRHDKHYTIRMVVRSESDDALGLFSNIVESGAWSSDLNRIPPPSKRC